MKVVILPGHQVREVRAGTVAQVLARLQLQQDAHLVIKGEDILTRDVRLEEDDEVEVIPVISGGTRE